MELTGSDKNQVKAGPDRDKEKKRTWWASLMDAYYACAILASELSKLREPVICRTSDQIIPL